MHWRTIQDITDCCTEVMGGQIIMLAILHTWARALVYHPYAHCLIPAGWLSPAMEWAAMMLKIFIYTHNLQQGLSDSTESDRMLFSLLPSCARMTIYNPSVRLQAPVPAGICIRHERIMKNSSSVCP